MVTAVEGVSRVPPPAPLITSTLCADSGLPASRALAVAQELYEAGRITYHRTDSPALSRAAASQIWAYIVSTHGREALCKRTHAARSNAQEAHEAIRPTRIELTELAELGGGDRKKTKHAKETDAHRAMYRLAWQRAVASQMADAVYATFEATVRELDGSVAGLSDVTFVGRARVLVSPGHLAVSESPQQQSDGDAKLQAWRALVGAPGGTAEARLVRLSVVPDATRPPPLYGEGDLVRAMEAAGIGRPSTYAPTLAKLFAKDYVKRAQRSAKHEELPVYTLELACDGVNTVPEVAESKAKVLMCPASADGLVPTETGAGIVDYLAETCAPLLDTGFTGRLEAELDAVARGAARREAVLGTFHANLKQLLPEPEQSGGEKGSTPKSNNNNNSSAVVREFSELGGAKLLRTKYGCALKRGDGTFLNVERFAAGRHKRAEALEAHDVRFLLALPAPYPPGGAGATLAYGRYGLYVQMPNGGGNQKLPEKDWVSAMRVVTKTAAA